MRNIVLATCATLLLAVCASGQVSKANPFGGEIKETFLGTDSKVITEVELLKETDQALSVPVANVTDVKMKVVSLTVKNASGELVTTTVNRQATALPDEGTQPMTKAFQLEISNQAVISPAAPFRLPRNWESYSYQITASVAGDPRSTAILHMQKPTGAVTVQKFNLRVDKPVWMKDSSGNKSTELSVPVTSTSASLVADVVLRQGGDGGAEAKTTEPVFLPKGKQTLVKLNVQNFGELLTEIRIRPTELEGVQLNLTGIDCPSSLSDAFCRWSPTFVPLFQIDMANVLNAPLKDLKVTSLEQPKTISFVLSDRAKTGSVKVKLNGESVNVTGNTNTFQIVLTTATLGNLKEGSANTLEFEGESLDGVKLPETKFTINKTTKPQLVGFPTFTLDGNSLRLTYELAGDVESSEPKLTFREGGGTAGTFDTSNCVKQASGNIKCSPALTVSVSEAFKKLPQVPVKLEIFATERGKSPATVGGSLGFDLLNQAAVKKVLDEVRANFKANGNEATAKQRIAAEVLKVEVTNEKVNETFDQYVKAGDTSDKRKKFLQFLTGVGNFALKGFGIPIQIPTDLVN